MSDKNLKLRFVMVYETTGVGGYPLEELAESYVRESLEDAKCEAVAAACKNNCTITIYELTEVATVKPPSKLN